MPRLSTWPPMDDRGWVRIWLLSWPFPLQFLGIFVSSQKHTPLACSLIMLASFTSRNSSCAQFSLCALVLLHVLCYSCFHQIGREFCDSAPRAENGTDCAQSTAQGQLLSSRVDCAGATKCHGECFYNRYASSCLWMYYSSKWSGVEGRAERLVFITIFGGILSSTQALACAIYIHVL